MDAVRTACASSMNHADMMVYRRDASLRRRPTLNREIVWTICGAIEKPVNAGFEPTNQVDSVARIPWGATMRLAGLRWCGRSRCRLNALPYNITSKPQRHQRRRIALWFAWLASPATAAGVIPSLEKPGKSSGSQTARLTTRQRNWGGPG